MEVRGYDQIYWYSNMIVKSSLRNVFDCASDKSGYGHAFKPNVNLDKSSHTQIRIWTLVSPRTTFSYPWKHILAIHKKLLIHFQVVDVQR